MRPHLLIKALALAVAVTMSFAVAAQAAKPAPGKWKGEFVGEGQVVAVSFKVNRGQTKLLNFDTETFGLFCVPELRIYAAHVPVSKVKPSGEFHGFWTSDHSFEPLQETLDGSFSSATRAQGVLHFEACAIDDFSWTARKK